MHPLITKKGIHPCYIYIYIYIYANPQTNSWLRPCQKAKFFSNLSIPIQKHAPSVYEKEPCKQKPFQSIQTGYSTQTALSIQDLMELWKPNQTAPK